MTLKRALIAVGAALCVLPASALAQSDQPGDSYNNAIILNPIENGQAQDIPDGSIPGFQIDTSTYGTQPDLFNPPGSGGPSEPLQCGNSNYGKTTWAWFFAHRFGRADVKAAGSFDEVIGLIPFGNPTQDPAPQISNGICVDRIAGLNEDFGNEPPIIDPGWWAIQIGGAGDTGGTLQGTLEFLRPSRLSGDAVWSWNGNGRGVAGVVKATAPKGVGATISFKCVNKRCGRLPKTQSIKKESSLYTFHKSIGDVTPRSVRNPVLKPVSDDPPVRAARSYLKGKFVPNGARLEIRITAPGYIGNYFAWTVKGGKAGTKVKRCLEPESTKPQRRCDGA
jgi:hypothetical protein